MPPKIIRRIDDPVNGRTKNLRSDSIGMGNLVNLKNKYIRDTCRINDTIVSIDEYLGEGTYGVVFAANYIANGNLIRNGVVKFIYESQDQFLDNLNEIKMGIELNINAPDYSIHNSIVDKCQILMTDNIATDIISPDEDILIIGLERGENHGTVDDPSTDLNDYLTLDSGDVKMLEQSMFAMDMFNRAGFFHRDIKPQNMTNVIRNGISMCVPIDYGSTDYIQDEHFLKNKSNPPIDAFHLGLYIYKKTSFSSKKKVDKYNQFNNRLNGLLSLYYTILIRLGVTKSDIRLCNKNAYDFYELEPSFTEFKKTYVRRKLTPNEIGLYMDGRTSKYPDIRLPNNLTIENLKEHINNLNRVFYPAPRSRRALRAPIVPRALPVHFDHLVPRDHPAPLVPRDPPAPPAPRAPFNILLPRKGGNRRMKHY
jgi:serine/threonine protein kinase